MSDLSRVWKEWLSEHGPRLLLYARGWAKTREDAEDLLQDSILKMWHYQHKENRGGMPPDLPLIFSTIRFAGLMLHRTEKRRRRREDSIIFLNDFEDVWLDPVVEQDEEAELLRGAVQRLSDKLREVVTLKVWGGLTFAQISETMAISPNTAASRYRYALEQLAKEMNQVKEARNA
ncbi:MAG: RNA polymerase sigma factor [Akkermansiaceae bacterium]